MLLCCCFSIKAQRTTYVDVDDFLKSRDHAGETKIRVEGNSITLLPLLHLIDTTFPRRFFAKSIQAGNYTDSEIKMLLRLAQVIKEETLNQRLGETLVDYRHSFQKTEAYREYPNPDIFRALCYQKSAASIPIIDAELIEWQQLKRSSTGNASRNQKIIRHTLEYLNTTKSILLNKNVSDSLLKAFLLAKSSDQLLLERPAKWDTLRLQHSYKQVQQIKFREEPGLQQLLEFGNFLDTESELSVYYKGTRAMLHCYRQPWESTFQLELLNDHQIAIRFLTGGIE
jgi:hypothetical protein